MEVFIAGLLLAVSIYVIASQFMKSRIAAGSAHLRADEFKDGSVLEAAATEEVLGVYKKSWLPLTTKFKEYAKSLPKGKIYHRLIKAGSPMGVMEFYAFKILMCLLVPVAAFTFGGNLLGGNKVTLLVFSLAIGYLVPEFWLKSKINKRQTQIRRDLPNIIDLLSLCVNGGLDFMLAVNRVVMDMRRCDLTIELEEVYRQTQMGKSRREALKNFAWRLDMPEIYSFVRTLVQADRMGSPVGEALKMQSEEIRTRRFQMGEAMALKAPIKLLFPLFAFILPVVLVIVGGPIILQFSRGGFNMGF